MAALKEELDKINLEIEALEKHLVEINKKFIGERTPIQENLSAAKLRRAQALCDLKVGDIFIETFTTWRSTEPKQRRWKVRSIYAPSYGGFGLRCIRIVAGGKEGKDSRDFYYNDMPHFYRMHGEPNADKTV